MARHFERERELQGRIEAELHAALPAIEVLEVELDAPREKVTLFIDSPDGIGFEECEAVTHAIRDTCPEYALEVSSPGIDRPLRKPAHFADVVGQQVRIRQQGRHRASLVEVLAVDPTAGVTVRPEGGDERVVPFDEIVRCRLVAVDPFATSSAAPRKKGRT